MLRRSKLPTTISFSSLSSSVSSLRTSSFRHLGSFLDRNANDKEKNSLVTKLTDTMEIGWDVRARERGRAYNRKQQLWPSIAALEKDMTKAKFAPAERLPPELLPADVAELQLEGRIPDDVKNDLAESLPSKESTASKLLGNQENSEDDKFNHSKSDTRTSSREMQMETQKQKQTTANNATNTTTTTATIEEQPNSTDDMMDMESLAAMAFSSSSSSSSPQIMNKDEKETNSSSRKKQILADLNSNDVSNPVATWSACGLDPVMEQRANEVLSSKGASRAQSRLLPALLNEDHNDVIFGSTTGSGKTIAMILAMIQGIRNESKGLNIFVCSDQTNCYRVVSFIKKFEEYGNLDVADVKSEYNEFQEKDPVRDDRFGRKNLLRDWLMVATRRENFETYTNELLESRKPLNRMKRLLVCTPDVLTEILFEKKLEFSSFGNLRRLYVDDISKDIRFAGPTATFEMKQKEYSDPSASQLLLGTVHQLMPVQARSLLQIACVAADMESDLSKHLLSLCVKPNHTLIACPSRLPATLHCVFSFYAQHTNDKYEYLTTLLRNASPMIPGRVLIFFPSDVDLLETRAILAREAGLDAKLLFEVKNDYFTSQQENSDDNNKNNNSEWKSGWRFLLLHEHEGFGLDIPLVSHVVLTFCPKNRFSLLHIAGRAGRRGDPGWVFTVVPRSEAMNVATLCKELDIDVTSSTIDVNLQNVDPNIVHKWTKQPDPWGLDPQYAVEKSYLRVDDASYDASKAEMFLHSRTRKDQDFMRVDYTPRSVLDKRYRQVEKLKRDVQNTPELAVEMSRAGMIDPNTLRPTKKLLQMMDANSSMPVVGKNGGYTSEEGRQNRERAKGQAFDSRLTD